MANGPNGMENGPRGAGPRRIIVILLLLAAAAVAFAVFGRRSGEGKDAALAVPVQAPSGSA